MPDLDFLFFYQNLFESLRVLDQPTARRTYQLDFQVSFGRDWHLITPFVSSFESIQSSPAVDFYLLQPSVRCTYIHTCQ